MSAKKENGLCLVSDEGRHYMVACFDSAHPAARAALRDARHNICAACYKDFSSFGRYHGLTHRQIVEAIDSVLDREQFNRLDVEAAIKRHPKNKRAA